MTKIVNPGVNPRLVMEHFSDDETILGRIFSAIDGLNKDKLQLSFMALGINYGQVEEFVQFCKNKEIRFNIGTFLPIGLGAVNRKALEVPREVIKKIDLGFFSLLLFGSYAEGKATKSSDIDILMIIENTEDTEKIERWLQQISEKYGDFHCNVINKESVKEMLNQREKLNVINETLNKHIIFFGAEDYYRLIS